MTAQIANGGYKIKPHIIYDKNFNYENIKLKISKQFINDSLIDNKSTNNYLEERELGAIVICNIRMGDNFDKEVNFIKENWKLEWKNQGLCNYGFLNKSL